MDSRTFTTDDEGALATMFGDGSDENPESGAAIKRTAVRLATVFATLKARIAWWLVLQTASSSNALWLLVTSLGMHANRGARKSCWWLR